MFRTLSMRSAKLFGCAFAVQQSTGSSNHTSDQLKMMYKQFVKAKYLDPISNSLKWDGQVLHVASDYRDFDYKRIVTSSSTRLLKDFCGSGYQHTATAIFAIPTPSTYDSEHDESKCLAVINNDPQHVKCETTSDNYHGRNITVGVDFKVDKDEASIKFYSKVVNEIGEDYIFEFIQHTIVDAVWLSYYTRKDYSDLETEVKTNLSAMLAEYGISVTGVTISMPDKLLTGMQKALAKS